MKFKKESYPYKLWRVTNTNQSFSVCLHKTDSAKKQEDSRKPQNTECSSSWCGYLRLVKQGNILWVHVISLKIIKAKTLSTSDVHGSVGRKTCLVLFIFCDHSLMMSARWIQANWRTLGKCLYKPAQIVSCCSLSIIL